MLMACARIAMYKGDRKSLLYLPISASNTTLNIYKSFELPFIFVVQPQYNPSDISLLGNFE